jgi:Stage II sporulation protein E (SpoIIE)
MASGRWRRAWITGSLALLGTGAALLSGGYADASAQGRPSVAPSASLLGAPAIDALLPSLSHGASSSGASAVRASIPGVSLPGLSLPGVGVSLPGVEVTVPGVEVSLPGITVSTPEVSVSTPEVSLSTPEISVSPPSSPSTGPAEAPATGGSPTGGGGTSGGEGGSSGGGGGSSTGGAGASGGGGGSSGGPPSSTANDSDNATAASVADHATGSTSSPTPVTAAHQRTSAGTVERSKRSARHSRRSGGGRGHANGSAAGVAAVGAVAPGSVAITAVRKAPASRARRNHTSNPLESIGKHIPLPLPVPDWSKPIIIALLLLAIWFGVRSRMAARRALRLERQRATLLRDVGVMQTALVPEIPARVGGLGVSVAYRPAEGPAAGGDFYDVFVPERGKVAIILGDVAGHGPRALTRAALTRYTLRAYLQAGLEPRAVLALAGRVLADPKAEHYATVAVGVYHAREGLLTYASAGHPPPILQGMQTREPLTICASPPVGWTIPTGRRQTTVSLAPGAVVCFFSDGLIEARCKEELLGRERLGEILASLGPRPDDMAACILTPEMAVVAARTHVEEFEADAKAIASGQVRRFLETCQVPTADIEATIELADEIVEVSATALLHVELESTTATATVSVPNLESQAAAL